LRAQLSSLALSLILFACAPGGDTLPQLGVEMDETSVSGLSAGAYMAGQLQAAHSEHIIGAGLVAGGPYGCAETPGNELLPTAARNFNRAIEGCMSDKLRSQGIPDVRALADQTEDLAEDGSIDPLTGLGKDRVYLFSGGKDHIVARSVVEAAQRFYEEVGVPKENITLVTRPDAGHTFLTVNTGNACEVTASPFLGDCDYDQAEAILKWIYGGLQRKSQRVEGKYVVFDQSPFASGFGHGLSSEGIVYVPKTCAKQGGCRVHIALHGCEQNRETVGMKFIGGSGFAQWADANRVVVLFPQVSAYPLLNPKGCWDWWGYTGEDYLTKDAPQIAAIWKMVERLAERPIAKVTGLADQHAVLPGKLPISQ
jgi:poly(3-hydroxybutyrate) depolymerase